MERVLYDGWRYLGLDAHKVLSLTPREFTILMQAQKERQYDEYERMAHEAFMMRQAYHAKRLKPSDLFKRPVDEGEAKAKSVALQEKAENATEWLAQFANFSGKEDVNG